MKCSRCGEECKDNQAFCLKCGTPIQVVPDFNLIEAELANNIGELMDADKNNELNFEEIDYLEDERYEEIMPEHEIEQELELVDIVNYENSVENDGYQVDASKLSDKKEYRRQNNKRQNGQQNRNQDSVTKNSKKQEDKGDNDIEIQQEKKAFKIKAIVFAMVAVIIIVIAVVMLNMLGESNKADESFINVYNQGYDSYVSKDYEKALELFFDAKALTTKKDDKIKVNKSILATYENLDNKDTEMIEILKELISLSPNTVDFYEQLVEIYDRNEMNKEITELIDGIDNVTVKAKLEEYIVAAPNFSDEGGDYNDYLSIKLTTSASNTIYYTLDGTEPTTSSNKYTEEIRLDREGTHTIKAIAVNSTGISSKVAENTYNISPSKIAGPTVYPAGGSYTETTQKDITVEVPQGYKCYYTYNEEGNAPTTSDTEYTEPVPMMQGKNIFSAVLVSETGDMSDVTQNIYQLSVNVVFSYDDALIKLSNMIVDENIASKVEGQQNQYVKANGNIITLSYNTIVVINNVKYYVIDAQETSPTGSRVNLIYYGVDTVTGEIKVLEKDTENAGQYKITE